MTNGSQIPLKRTNISNVLFISRMHYCSRTCVVLAPVQTIISRFLLHLPSRWATTCAVTSRAARTKSPTRPQGARGPFLIRPGGRTAPGATAACRTTAAGDRKLGAPCSSSLASPTALSFWHSLDIQGTHTHTHSFEEPRTDTTREGTYEKLQWYQLKEVTCVVLFFKWWDFSFLCRVWLPLLICFNVLSQFYWSDELVLFVCYCLIHTGSRRVENTNP